MALLLRHDDVAAAVDMRDAIEAMEFAFAEEGCGGVHQPPRLNMPAGKPGKTFLRIGPCVMQQAGWMGFKAMNLAENFGARFQIHLYSLADGELRAIMDGHLITTLRTGATSAVATKRLARKEPGRVAVLGAGREAFMQLEAMRVLGLVASARVYSPTPSSREAFAGYFRNTLGMDIAAATSAKAAVDGATLVVAAVASSEPVLMGEWLAPGTHVNSVGTARPILREVDPEVFRRSAILAVDTREGVFSEAGDCVAVKDWLRPEQAIQLSELVADDSKGRSSDEQITLFKSVGSAVQDIALAIRVYQNAMSRGLGQEVGVFPIASEKKFPKLRH
jgi:ornithine cyclodeaminase/alanine dehydrogenase-like protein (mu-crystallin family)